LKKIVNDLKVQELVQIMRPWVTRGTPNAGLEEGQKNQFAELLFQSSAGYERLLEHASARSILEALAVKELYEPSRLRSMLQTVSQSPHTNNLQNNPQLFSFYELLRWFAKMKGAAELLLQKQKVGQLAQSEGIVELEFLEYADERGIRPERLSVFTSTVTELHGVVSRIYGQENQLTFIYLDFGTKFLIAAKCAKEVAEVMNTLLNLWDKVFFWKHETLSKNLAALSETLDFTEKVHQQVEKGIITSEDGETLKARAFRAVEKLTGIGEHPQRVAR
jgi:hypothetical protein